MYVRFVYVRMYDCMYELWKVCVRIYVCMLAFIYVHVCVFIYVSICVIMYVCIFE